MAILEVPAQPPPRVEAGPDIEPGMQGLPKLPAPAIPLAAALPGIGAAAAAVVERVTRSVVEVRTSGGGAGAGIIWDAGGTIVTNHHVLPRDRARVTLSDGRSFEAQVTARDELNDLAVAQVEASDLPAAAIGDARRLRPGELVLAVGHPFGVRSAASIGVTLAALAQDGPWRRELIAADVRLGPGNSGGPLIDAAGRVVGVNAMVSGGMALAVPSHLAADLVAGGSRRRSVLGVEVHEVELPPAMAAEAARMGASGDGAVRSGFGLLVFRVEPGSAAERAGLLVGDILLAMNGTLLGGAAGLRRALGRHTTGPVPVGMLRGGKPLTLVAEPAPEKAG